MHMVLANGRFLCFSLPENGRLWVLLVFHQPLLVTKATGHRRLAGRGGLSHWTGWLGALQPKP